MGLVEHIDELRSPGSRCSITWQRTDAEEPDPIVAHCGVRRLVITRNYHNSEAHNLTPCRAVLMVSGVQIPRLFDAQNCNGHFESKEIGVTWVRALAKANGFSVLQVKSVFYAPIHGASGCYKVTLWLNRRRASTDGPLEARSAKFCIPGVGR